MKKLMLILVFLSSINFAQYWEGGVQLNPAYAANEFDGFKLSYVVRGLARYYLTEDLNLEVGVGYGQYKGTDFKEAYYASTIIPFDLRLNYLFHLGDSYAPYVYAGVGGLHYDVTNTGLSHFYQWPQKDVEENGITAVVPAGLGVIIKLSDELSFDLSAGFNYTLTDNLNYYREGSPKDVYYNAGLGIIYGHQWVDKDSDNDGLLDKEEEQLGTDPLKADTDGDGLSDGDEVRKHSTNPLVVDTDNDGINDNDEIFKFKTKPLVADTDGDGLNDGAEVNTHKTEPTKVDTDGDGLTDSEEINTYKTNALITDTDKDGLVDGAEIKTYKTNPLVADTDADKLNDGDEVDTFKTNPLVVDTDADGLTDGEEVSIHKTNPLKADTDAGSVNDKIEVTRGTDPLDASDDEIKVGVPMILEGITFASSKADITPESEVSLKKALRTLNAYPELEVSINGYTDNVGKKASNIKLSQKRADAVKKWLVDNGIDAKRLTAKGYGPANPIGDNKTVEGKLKNRRIEFVRIK